MIFKSFISKYLNEDSIEDIVFHSWSIIIKDSFKAIWLLAILYAIFYVLNYYISREFLPRIFGILWASILVNYWVDAFDKWIDCIVLTKSGITFFARDKYFKYKTDFFGRDSIEAISHLQKSFWDKLFVKWDLKITLSHEIVYSFEDVSNPKKKAKKIIQLKEKFLKKIPENNLEKANIDPEHLGILSEALSEVIKEYLEKKD